MPPRRGRGRKPVTPTKAEPAPALLDTDVEMAEVPQSSEEAASKSEQAGDPMEVQAESAAAPAQTNGDVELPADDVAFPFQVKVSHLPPNFNLSDFQQYLASTFKVIVPKVTSHDKNTLVKIYLKEKEPMESLVRLLNNHVWKRKCLHAEPWLPLENRKRKREEGGDDQEQKKNKTDEEEKTLTLEEEILSESLPLLNVSEEDQTPASKKERKEKVWMTEELKAEVAKTYKLYRKWKDSPPSEERRKVYHVQRNFSSKLIKAAKFRYEIDSVWNVDPACLEGDGQERLLSHQDAVLMSKRLHGLMCSRNDNLAGWAEASCDQYGGTLFQIDPVMTCASLVGYRSKCKFRIGKNSDGETVVGFCLTDNETKILGVEPGDKLVHLPDAMKLAAKRLQEFIRESGTEAFDRKKKTGVWDNLLVRVAPDGRVMMVVVVSPTGLDDDGLEKIKEDLKTFFSEGKGKDTNLLSLFIQRSVEQHVAPSADKLSLILGQPDFEETICGLRFLVSPFSILNINPYSMENIYLSVEELANPSPDSVVIDVCAGSCGIAFTLAKRCKKAIAIEPQEQNFEDALRTKELNNIENVLIIKGKCEEKLEKILEDNKDESLVIILDPPRHGVGIKVIALIRAQSNVERIVYVCSNTKTGTKNLLELCAVEGKDTQSGLQFSGHPFVPKRVIPIDVAPFTINNTVPILLERVDPSTFPAPTKPVPEPMNRNYAKKKPQQQAKARIRNRQTGRMQRPPGAASGRGMRGRGGPARFPAPPLMRGAMRALMGRGGPPRRGPGPVPSTRFVDPSIISKYERRIAELEQQDRAFKAGLSMGLQALTGYGGAPAVGASNPRNMGDYSTGEGFGGYRGGYKDPYGENSSPWQSNQPQFGRASFGSSGSYGGGYGNGRQGGGFGGGQSGGFGGGQSGGFSGQGGGFGGGQAGGFSGGFGGPDRGRQNQTQRTNPLSGSRFVGVGDRTGRGGGARGSRGGNRGQRGGWNRR